MAKRFLTPISLANLSADPTGSAGAFYYNNSANTLKYYNGTTWVTLGSGPTAATAPVTYNSGTQTVALNIGSSLTTSSSNLIVDSTVVPYLANANTFTAANTFAPTSTGVVPLTINIPSGSSANLLNLQNNGTAQFTVASYGTTNTNGSVTALGGGVFRSGAIGQIPLIAKGYSTSQTGDLQQWQNSVGTILGGANAAGQIYAGTTASVVGSTTTALTSAAYTSATVAVFTYGGTSLVQAGQTVTVAGVTGGAYNGTWTVSAVTSTTFTVLGSGFTNNAGSGGTFKLSAVGSFVAGSAAITPLIVQSAASQTVNLQEWQNSVNGVLARVNQNGNIGTAAYFGSTTNGVTNLTPNFDTSGMGIVIQNAAHKGLVFRAAASQTANLQEWQNSAGTVLTSILAAGTINFASGNTSATATAGAITAPVLVTGYITMQIAGTTVKVPYYSN